MKPENKKLSDARQLREKAEQRLKEQQAGMGAPPPQIDAQRLIHELQVHQIELELQNEELHQAWDKAETALKKYTVFFDFAPVAYFMLDREAAIDELNYAAAELLGDKRMHLTRSNFRLFVAESSRPLFNAFFQEMYANQGRESCEISLVDREDESSFVHLEGAVLEKDGPCFLAVVDLAGTMR